MKYLTISQRTKYLELLQSLFADGYYRISTPEEATAVRTTIFVDGDMLTEVDGSQDLTNITSDITEAHGLKLQQFLDQINVFKNDVKLLMSGISVVLGLLLYLKFDLAHFNLLSLPAISTFFFKRFDGPIMKWVMKFGGKYLLKGLFKLS
ncbi:MAG: hypothetical protein HEP71_06165 [Roseivirga sp.]|nr:hypothetical protein [Roseivirga sp.]